MECIKRRAHSHFDAQNAFLDVLLAKENLQLAESNLQSASGDR